MNILFVNSTRKWGGVKTWCIDMSTKLAEKGHNTWIIGRPGPFTEKAEQLGVLGSAHTFGPDFNPKSIYFFIKFMKKHDIDVVICNISKGLRTAGVAARLLGIPVVHRLGAPRDVVNSFKTNTMQLFLNANLLCCSEFVRSYLLESVPLYKRYNFKAIHPGTRINQVPPSTVNTPRTIIATSQLIESKGHDQLLVALAALKKRNYQFKCIIVGTGGEEKRLKELCTNLDLDGQVEWTGFVTDVQSKLNMADIFVLPTFCEPLGIALEEAMANGLVSVARNTGGPTEIWPDKLKHLLIDPESNAKGFEQALADLLDLSDEELLQMKQDFREHATTTFSLDLQADKFISWMEKFVK
ncbi:glycosyltransferase [Desulfovibrio sp. JC010]|uniref:glycosyltransferase n=1 Tax=Desulfovibrio sp. JC010 TaxID=2593641 RepID=UPI0023B269D5|nr:glycosyltransferase [Desulfovibrio sp. JC010]NDV28733.1 glycosyltransferase [Desulfovibrio sp. JC010]